MSEPLAPPTVGQPQRVLVVDNCLALTGALKVIK